MPELFVLSSHGLQLLMCAYVVGIAADGATECGAITSNGIPIAEKGVSVKLVPLGAGVDDAVTTLGGTGEVWVSSRNMSQGDYFLPTPPRYYYSSDTFSQCCSCPASAHFTHSLVLCISHCVLL